MANSLPGAVSIDVVARSLCELMKKQQAELVGRGYSEEQAWAIVANAFNNFAWNMGTNPSPLGG